LILIRRLPRFNDPQDSTYLTAAVIGVPLSWPAEERATQLMEINSF
jgi:hypothetical protein